MKMIRRIKWFFNGKPLIKYSGYHCGLCGKWVNKPFTIPEYNSNGWWWDLWGTCDECTKS